jgi:adenylate kinase family enzyme
MTMESIFPYRRIVVIGTTGSGKSTLAEQLANKLGVDFVELDALNWGPDWTAAGDETLRVRAEEATRSSGWVVAGNYSVTRPITWTHAETIVWLDYSFRVIFWRLWTRTRRRVFTQEELWGGNRERISTQLKLWSDESLFHWFFKTYWRRKREYPQLFAAPEYSHLQIIHLKNPKQIRELLAQVDCRKK